jgi:dinuclear metal center YbgI/SA1388 family protein
MRILDLGQIIEKISPLELQESWDNSGFQIILSDREVKRVMVALEITNSVIHEAIEEKIDVIVTHHPMIFKPVKNIDHNNVTGNYVIKLIENHIDVYSSHTPFDKCQGGNNDYLASLLALCDLRQSHCDEEGFLKVGIVDGECTALEYIDHVADKLLIDKRAMSFVGNIDQVVDKVCLCTGAGADFIEAAAKEGCDLYITGDVKYHQACLAKELGINVLDIGHYGSEKIFIRNMADYLRKSTDLEIIEAKSNTDPFSFI